MNSLRFLTAALLAAGMLTAAHAQGIRPEVAKPLQAASDLLKAGKAKEALAKAREADAMGGKTPSEQLVIDRMKGAAAQRVGDTATTIAAFESVYGRGVAAPSRRRWPSRSRLPIRSRKTGRRPASGPTRPRRPAATAPR